MSDGAGRMPAPTLTGPRRCSTRIDSRIMAIAVLDVGKTNAKVLLLDEAGTSASAAFTSLWRSPGRPTRIWTWTGSGPGQLQRWARLRRIAPVECIVPVAHGAAAVLMAGEEPALPALDYEHPGPDAIAGDSARHSTRSRHRLAGAAAGPVPGRPALLAGADLPEAFAARHRVPAAGPVLGVAAVGREGDRGHLAGRAHPSLATRRGAVLRAGRAAWLGRVASRPCGGPGTRWARCGRSSPQRQACRRTVGCSPASTTAMPPICRIWWRAQPPFTVLSTGTWIIAMAPGRSWRGWTRMPTCWPTSTREASRCRPRGSWAGARSSWWPVPTALRTPAARDEVAAIVAEGVMALPSFVAGSGPFIGRQGGIMGDAGAAARRAVPLWPRSMPRLPSTSCWTNSGAAGPVLVEGSFHRNAAFCGLLAALRCRPDRPRHRRSQRHRARRVAAGPLAGPPSLARNAARWRAGMGDPRPGRLSGALAPAQR